MLDSSPGPPPPGGISLGGGAFFGQPLIVKATKNTPPTRQHNVVKFLIFPRFSSRHAKLLQACRPRRTSIISPSTSQLFHTTTILTRDPQTPSCRQHQIASIRRPRGVLSSCYLLRLSTIKVDGHDLKPSSSTRIGNTISFRRPSRRGIVLSFESETPGVATVDIHHINLWTATAVRAKGNLSSVRRPRGRNFNIRAVSQAADESSFRRN